MHPLNDDESLPVPPVKTLVFEMVGEPEDCMERCQTPFGSYELQGFPKGFMVSFQWSHTARRIHDRVGLTRAGAIEKAQADFNERVLGCLQLSECMSNTHVPTAPEDRPSSPGGRPQRAPRA